MMSPRPWEKRRSFRRDTSSFSSRTSRLLGSSLITALQRICLARSAYLRGREGAGSANMWHRSRYPWTTKCESDASRRGWARITQHFDAGVPRGHSERLCGRRARSLPECAEGLVVVDVCGTQGGYHRGTRVSPWQNEGRHLSFSLSWTNRSAGAAKYYSHTQIFSQ